MKGKSRVQGEGNYEAARKYGERMKEYLEHADVEADARRAKPNSGAEAKEIERAEQEGKRRAKDEDPWPRTVRRSTSQKNSK